MSKHFTSIAAASALFALAGTAQAATAISAVNGPDGRPASSITYDFSNPGATPWNGAIYTGATVGGESARPAGTDNVNWASVGVNGTGTLNGVAQTTAPSILSLSSFGSVQSITFLWGSIDTYNTLKVLDKNGLVIASYDGNDVAVPAGGNQFEADENRLVTLSFSGATVNNIGGLQFESTQNAFEFTNVAVVGVPEPGAWALMISGFALLGAALRRRVHAATA